MSIFIVVETQQRTQDPINFTKLGQPSFDIPILPVNLVAGHPGTGNGI